MSDGEPRMPQIHDVVDGKYEILRHLGQGGMGSVFEARSLALGRTVALKLLHPDLSASARIVERFQREARNAASIKHPSVCHVYEVGRTEDRLPYMAMELLEGRSLAAEIDRNGPLRVREAVHVTLRILNALEAAHRVGVVHRDLKPDNVFLVGTGAQPEVKILDFGISKFLGNEEHSLTKAGTMLGTPAYMSPEQIRNARGVDHRTDLYSLGVVLYEMLAGKPAFTGETFTAVVFKILGEPPPTLPSMRSGVDAGLLEIVERAMDKDRSRRFASAAAMRMALDEVCVETAPGETKPTPLSWELPSPEEASAAATVAVRGLRPAGHSTQRGAPPPPAVPHTQETVAERPSPVADPAAAPPTRVSSPRTAGPRESGARAPIRATPPSRVDRPAARPTETGTGTVTAGATAAGSRGVAVVRQAPVADHAPLRWMWWGVPLVALAGGLAAGLALWWRTDGAIPVAIPSVGLPPLAVAAAPPPPSLVPPLLPPFAPPSAAPPTLAPPDAPTVDVPGGAEAAPASCRLRISVSTPDAIVRVDGVRQHGVVDVEAACSSLHDVRIAAPGHASAELTLEARPEHVHRVSLAPSVDRRTSPRARRRPRSPPRDATRLEANPF